MILQNTIPAVMTVAGHIDPPRKQGATIIIPNEIFLKVGVPPVCLPCPACTVMGSHT